MLCDGESLIVRELFQKYGYSHQDTAKVYLLHKTLQDWQVSFLYKTGLKPHHEFLDVGCGWLRLAVALLPYLEEGRYHGVDATQRNLDIGRELLCRLGVRQQPQLLCNADFPFERFGKQFDVVFCHAVLTHLSHAQIEQCIENLSTVTKPGAMGYFTFYLAERDSERPQIYRLADGETLEFSSAFVSLKYFHSLFKRLDLKWDYLKGERHPTGQQVIRVRFTGRPVRSVVPEKLADIPSTALHMRSAGGMVDRSAARIREEVAPGLYHSILSAPGPYGMHELPRWREEVLNRGYAVVRRFCSEADSVAIRECWHRHPMPTGKKGYWIGRPDFAMHALPRRHEADGERWPVDLRYECLFWNRPVHRLSYEIAWAANAVRNAVVGSDQIGPWKRRRPHTCRSLGSQATTPHPEFAAALSIRSRLCGRRNVLNSQGRVLRECIRSRTDAAR
ncbi:MAG: class I SAM-dependent methyltransferase [Nitrospirae bacterium]|nr:class I SAM-dependent methyltransferase [Nitrospirota bacterium]